MKYLPDSVMLDTLIKVQELQSTILTAGYSAHLDAGVHENWPDIRETHINFELTIFDGTELIRTFDFNASDSEAVIEATYNLALAYTRFLKANV